MTRDKAADSARDTCERGDKASDSASTAFFFLNFFYNFFLGKTPRPTRAFQRTRFRAVWGTIGRGKYLNGHCFPVFFRFWAIFATKTFSIRARFLSFLDEHHHKFSAQSEYRVKTYGGAKKSQKKVEGSEA